MTANYDKDHAGASGSRAPSGKAVKMAFGVPGQLDLTNMEDKPNQRMTAGAHGDGPVSSDFVRGLAQKGETLDVEFKSEPTAETGDADLVKAAACLANRKERRYPAWLLLGIGDDGTILGAHPGTDASRLKAKIAEKTNPRLNVTVHDVTIEGKKVYALKIPVATVPIATSDGIFRQRVYTADGKPECRPMNVHDVTSLEAAMHDHDPTRRVLPNVSWKDLDSLEFDRFRRSAEERPKGDPSVIELTDNFELAKALGVVDANGEMRGIRLAGLLLFGKVSALQRHIPEPEVAIQMFQGSEIKSNHFYRWPLLRIIEELETRVRSLTLEREMIVGFVRVGIPNYHPDVVREALANAVTHRDYSAQGATHVQWSEDLIEISNPGGFPAGVTHKNLLVTPPRPRNYLLANAFQRAGVVDQASRGIDMMFENQLKNGYPPPSYDLSNEKSVTVSLVFGEPNMRFARLMVEMKKEGREIKMNDLLVLHNFEFQASITAAKAGELIQRPGKFAKPVLGNLREAGLIETQGKGARQRWIGTDRLVSTLKSTSLNSERSDPVSSTPEQSASGHAGKHESGTRFSMPEQKILAHVSKYGRITRQEAATLCRIDLWKASRLLRNLGKKKNLTKLGSKRGTYYGKGPEFVKFE